MPNWARRAQFWARRAQNGKNWARSRPVFLKIRNFRIELKTEEKLQITFFGHISSTLSLWHLSRAFTLENHRWVRGTHFTDERSKLTNFRNFKKIFLDFSFLFFF